MSVYSGFATRQQETKYNGLVENLVIALKKRVIKFYRGEACDEDKFKLLLKKIYKKMYILEKGKFMAPKYSTCFTDLIDALSIDIDYDTLSDASSLASQTFSIKRDPTDAEEGPVKSRVILQNKKSMLEAQKKRESMIDASTFSLNKNIKSEKPDQEESDNKRSTSLGIEPNREGNGRGKIKLR